MSDIAHFWRGCKNEWGNDFHSDRWWRRRSECEVLFTFNNKETGLYYIVYTDNTYSEDGSNNIFASTYNPDEEWGVIEKVIEKLQK